MTSSCCKTQKEHDNHHKHEKSGLDPVLHGSLAVIFSALALSVAAPDLPYAEHFAHTIIELFSVMWWGILLGMFFVGLMSKVPREYFQAILGRGDTLGGILRAALAGVLLDLCSHGILMVGAKLYERGASLPQVMTFLIASPWNSLSLTLILVALVGLKWTLVFIAASAMVAVITGIIFKVLIERKILPDNPHTVAMPENFSLRRETAKGLRTFKPGPSFFAEIARTGWIEGRMLLRWLLLGMVIAASIRTFVPTEIFSQWFGPTLLGLFMTLIATTLIEVCSEGSTPVAAEILNRAGAPGNAFTFLMAGVATDYTEVMVVREVTKSWKIALALPLVTVPQVLAIGWLMNSLQ